jgi:hypothetical protein
MVSPPTNKHFSLRNKLFAAENMLSNAENMVFMPVNKHFHLRNSLFPSRNTCAISANILSFPTNTCAMTDNTCAKTHNTRTMTRNTHPAAGNLRYTTVNSPATDRELRKSPPKSRTIPAQSFTTNPEFGDRASTSLPCHRMAMDTDFPSRGGGFADAVRTIRTPYHF